MIDLKQLRNSFLFAFEGIFLGLKYNQNLRIAFGLGFLTFVAGLYFRIPTYDMGIIGVASILLISAEMINTALEEMVNLIINEHRREAKIAKDVSAGMVLVVLIGSLILDCVIFTPYIFDLFGLR